MKIREKYRRKRMRKRQLLTMFVLGVITPFVVMSFTRVLNYALDYSVNSIVNQFDNYNRCISNYVEYLGVEN